MDGIAARVQVCAILAARDDQDFDVFQDLIQAPVRFLGDQPKLVIVAEQELGALHVSGQLAAFQAQHLLAGVVKVGDIQLAALGRELHHRIRRTGRDNHQVGTLIQSLDGLTRRVGHRSGIERSDLGGSLVRRGKK